MARRFDPIEWENDENMKRLRAEDASAMRRVHMPITYIAMHKNSSSRIAASRYAPILILISLNFVMILKYIHFKADVEKRNQLLQLSCCIATIKHA
jgi:hypothetical protein